MIIDSKQDGKSAVVAAAKNVLPEIKERQRGIFGALIDLIAGGPIV